MAESRSGPATTSVYIHFPYCSVRCRYCDFNVARKPNIPRDLYTESVVMECSRRAAEYRHRTLRSIYFGGGTPSLWGAAHVGRVIQTVLEHFPDHDSELEITLEMNPSEASAAELHAYREAGVTRLSLGLQSLSDSALTLLNRGHTAAEGLDALTRALDAGFESVSADLIFGLPNLTEPVWRETLFRVATTGVPHLSIYHLTLEPKTGMERAVSRGRMSLPGEDEEALQWEAIEPALAPFQLERYEISSYARRGHESRHNVGYWQGQPYLGLGAGAHSFAPPRVWSESAVAVRRENTRAHTQYMALIAQNGEAEEWTETVDRATHVRERLFTGLRYAPGIAIDALSDELRVDVEADFGAVFQRLVSDGLATYEGGRLALTARGVTLGDTVAKRIFDAR